MKKQKKRTRIGIWGFGVVGQSALIYFRTKDCLLEVLDSKKPNKQGIKLLAQTKTPFYTDTDLEQFLQRNDTILASPGIDVRHYNSKYQHKWLTELDILHKERTCPLIAITGTVGKTTITHLLSALLKKQGIFVWTGGNIGTGMLGLLNASSPVDCAVLEVSSFQLEQCTTFAPDLAIWTNLHENHLDRHGTMENYYAAKKKIITCQKSTQHALVPFFLIDKLSTDSTLQSTMHFFSTKKPTTKELKKLKPQHTVFFIDKKKIMSCTGAQRTPHVNTTITKLFAQLPSITFTDNIFVTAISAYLTTLLIDNNKALRLSDTNLTIKLPPHRLEKVTTRNGIDFYNDSKSTTAASTIAAVQLLSQKPILLLLGGLSKGVDRTDLIKQVAKQTKALYAFGAEANLIQQICKQMGVPCFSFVDLESALAHCTHHACSGDQILLSPAGASFDLFKNYKERGNHFKKLISMIQ